MRTSQLGAHRCTTWTGCSACPSPVVGASLLAPSSTPPDWRFNHRKGGSPAPLQGFGSARRSASSWAASLAPTNRRWHVQGPPQLKREDSRRYQTMELEEAPDEHRNGT